MRRRRMTHTHTHTLHCVILRGGFLFSDDELQRLGFIKLLYLRKQLWVEGVTPSGRYISDPCLLLNLDAEIIFWAPPEQTSPSQCSRISWNAQIRSCIEPELLSLLDPCKQLLLHNLHVLIHQLMLQHVADLCWSISSPMNSYGSYCEKLSINVELCWSACEMWWLWSDGVLLLNKC